MSYRSISVMELHRLSEGANSLEVIDVRTPVEFREMHATLSTNAPLDSLDPAAVMRRRGGSADDPVYVICRGGNRSRTACERFLAAGYTNIVNVEGGSLAWEEAGLPVNRGKEAMSLERQVRVAAGALVLLGVLLAAFVHPYFVGLSALVGAGLVFAGLTDTCGMGMLLAKMPWNRGER